MFTITDHTAAILAQLEGAKERALERMGNQAVGYAQDLSPTPQTGALRNSITKKVDVSADEVYIGTNVKYAPYVELGTGIYAEGGGGRPTPWAYQDEKGDWHHTRGQEPQPYLRPAVEDHKKTYRNIVADEIQSSFK